MSTALTKDANLQQQIGAEKAPRHDIESTSPDGSFDDVKSKDGVAVTTTSRDDEIAPLGIAAAEKRFWWQRRKDYDPDAIATQLSVFDDADTAKKYQPPAEWENIHRFDPSARWTWGEENSLIKKIDLKIMVWACLMFMSLELDRANIGQAVTDNFLKDLNLDTNDFNLGNTVFKLSFLCAELPSQLVSKWIGPDRWIPAQMTLWSIVAAAQFWLSGRSSFLTCRALLGLLQGGFVPDIILYLSYFYKHHELSIRLGFFWVCYSLADIIAAFLAAGILSMRGVHNYAGWRWMFLIEGLLTLVFGLASFVLMPASPTQTASRLRGRKGWFTEREEVIMVNRIIREDPTKSSMHNREAITPKLLWKGLCDYDLWPMYLIGMCFTIPVVPPAQYLTQTLKGLGFDTFKTNLLVIPSTVLSAINMLILTYTSEVFSNLAPFAAFPQLWVLPFLVVLYVLDITAIDKWTAFAIMTLLLSKPTSHPIQVAWNSRNSNGVRARTVSAALYNMSVQAGGIIGSNIYREDDKPRYRRGNTVLLAICVLNLFLYASTKVYYVWRNSTRSKQWNSMSEEERLNYLATTKDDGNKRLDFRFAH